ncbi:hypothetical protein EVAR_30370_1 [Eumeta japonica]|uniref:Uncharacterized protein n=1 Tax=Eumeta variegata TaxID=151549 RepID=A0A4C1W597_EUMVA|nr:hypothetical protein EVAR_30370_1 [Eumeta japonica]
MLDLADLWTAAGWNLLTAAVTDQCPDIIRNWQLTITRFGIEKLHPCRIDPVAGNPASFYCIAFEKTNEAYVRKAYKRVSETGTRVNTAESKESYFKTPNYGCHDTNGLTGEVGDKCRLPADRLGGANGEELAVHRAPPRLGREVARDASAAPRVLAGFHGVNKGGGFYGGRAGEGRGSRGGPRAGGARARGRRPFQDIV